MRRLDEEEKVLWPCDVQTVGSISVGSSGFAPCVIERVSRREMSRDGSHGNARTARSGGVMSLDGAVLKGAGTEGTRTRV